MTKYPWGVVAAWFVVVPATADAAKSAQSSPLPVHSSTVSLTNAFVLHKTAGDKAAAQRRFFDALDSYQNALNVKWDPFVSGRIGEIFFELRDFALAAQYLQRAITAPSGSLSDVDRNRFSKKLSTALREVCQVDFVVDPMDARVVIDGIERSKGQAQFWVYLNPGDHKIHADSAEFQPFDTVMTTGRGCRRTLIVVLHPAPFAQTEAIVAQAVTTNSASSVEHHDSSKATPPLYGAKLPPNLSKQGKSGNYYWGLGLWIPFGMTPGDGSVPGFGVGGLGQVGWRSSWWDVGGELRVAGALNSELKDVKYAATWTLGPVPCARHRSGFFGCGLAHLAGGAAHGGEQLWTAFGFGARGGYEFHLYDWPRIRLSLDAMVHLPKPEFVSGDRVVWAGSSLTLAINMTVLQIR